MTFGLSKHHFIFVILLLISLWACFSNLGSPDLVRWDEYTNYRVIADTIESGNFFILQYKDSLTGNFFEKPPLWYWLTEIVIKIGGMNNFNLRLVTAISGVGVLMTIFYLGRKIASTKAGIIAWFVAILTPHFFVSFNSYIFSTHTFKSADLDALQLLFILLAFNFFLNLLKKYTNKDIVIASFFTALAYLTKGPFAFLPGVLFFSFVGIQFLRGNKAFNFKQILKLVGIYILVVVLIAGTWFGWMSYLFRWDFINEYFIYHNIKRVATPLEGHGGNAMTFVHYLFNKQLFLFAEVLFIAFIFLVSKYNTKIFEKFELYFPLIGAIFVFIFLTFTQTKIAWYLFYLYPFACLVIGLSAHEFLKPERYKIHFPRLAKYLSE